MYLWSFFVGSIALLGVGAVADTGCKGCVSLDEVNFDKIISRFEAVLVKFDVAYPYGDKHNAFINFAKEVTNSPDFILAEVGVKDYGDRANEALAKKYGIAKEDLPQIRLFVTNKPVLTFPQDADYTVENLRDFVKDNTHVYVGLPGCLEQFDALTMEFVATSNKQAKIEEAERAAANLNDGDRAAANTYIKFMKKIVASGANFVLTEVGRLNKILKEGKINDKKKAELSDRLNILRSFSVPKDEL